MNEQQFDLHMEALERIRCGIIDVETAMQNIKVELPSASANTASLKLPGWDEVEMYVRRTYSCNSHHDEERLLGAKGAYEFIARQLQA